MRREPSHPSRLFERAERQWEIECHFGKRRISGYLINLSKNGGLFRSRMRFSPEMEVELHFPGVRGRHKRLHGKVIRSISTPGSVYLETAVRFQIRSNQERSLIHRLMQRPSSSKDSQPLWLPMKHGQMGQRVETLQLTFRVLLLLALSAGLIFAFFQARNLLIAFNS